MKKKTIKKINKAFYTDGIGSTYTWDPDPEEHEWVGPGYDIAIADEKHKPPKLNWEKIWAEFKYWENPWSIKTNYTPMCIYQKETIQRIVTKYLKEYRS